MTSEQAREIDGYISRMIPDIARKCGVKQDAVLNRIRVVLT